MVIIYYCYYYDYDDKELVFCEVGSVVELGVKKGRFVKGYVVFLWLVQFFLLFFLFAEEWLSGYGILV